MNAFHVEHNVYKIIPIIPNVEKYIILCVSDDT